MNRKGERIENDLQNACVLYRAREDGEDAAIKLAIQTARNIRAAIVVAEDKDDKRLDELEAEKRKAEAGE